MVISRIPKAIIHMFMVTCLGHVSSIYRRVICESFSMPAEISGITTRLMAAGVSFVGLADDAFMGISKARLRERLKATFRREEEILCSDEIEHFVNFVFQDLTDVEACKSSSLELRKTA